MLETAAGTGVVTRALAERLDPRVRILVTDLNQPMLDHAASRLLSERITWRRADALALAAHFGAGPDEGKIQAHIVVASR